MRKASMSRNESGSFSNLVAVLDVFYREICYSWLQSPDWPLWAAGRGISTELTADSLSPWIDCRRYSGFVMLLKRFPNSAKKIRKRNRCGRNNLSKDVFKAYIFRVLNRVHTGLGISQKATSIMNLILFSVFHMIAAEGARLGNSSDGGRITICEI